ncbi:Extra-large guanine nucleotide-binding protein 1 [Linum perenne]
MADGSKARLVRCPKCRNLLTELPDFSVYQCGGCSAVLRAKKKALNGRESDGDSYDKLESLSESEGGISMIPSVTHKEKLKDKSSTFFSREKGRAFRQRASDMMINTSSVDSIGNRRRMVLNDKQKGFESNNGVPHIRRPFTRPLKHQNVDELLHRRGVDRMVGGDARGECSTSSSYGYGRIRRDHDHPLDGAATTTRIANLEHDRAELLRKVDELSHQLNNTCVQYTVPGSDHVCDSSCLKQYGHHMRRRETGEFQMPSPLHNKVVIPAPFSPSRQQSPRGYFSSNFSQEQRFKSRPHETLYHQQPAAYSSSIRPSSHGYNARGNSYGFHPQDPPIHTRWQGDASGFHEDHHPQRKVAAQRNRRFCRPILYGAPFIVCCACFELLKLPGKAAMKEKDKLKLRCGSCSAVLMLEFESKKLMVSLCEEDTESQVKIVDGSCDVVNEVHGNGVNVCEDSGDLGHVEVQSTTLRESIPAEEQVLTCQSEKKKDYASSSSSSSSSFCSHSVSSEEEESLDDVVVPREVSSATDLAAKDDEAPSMRTLQYEENSIDSIEPLSLQRKGDRITHTRDQTSDSRITSRQSSRKDGSAIEAAREEEEFSFNDYVNMDSSADSIDTSKSKPAPIHRWIETSLAGVFKKSLRDLAKPPQQVKNTTNNKKANVFVNGQPIHEHALRMAEKLAGPIHAGDYWYDFRAGFWGVMGQPCLGVIPAFIEEFNYPMPRNCGGGKTGVFVNGRELHEQDLELLSKRGLPTLEHKFYTLEIDGRLYDNDTRKELHGIGKLAPTVEKVKRGFGMRVPSESDVE